MALAHYLQSGRESALERYAQTGIEETGSYTLPRGGDTQRPLPFYGSQVRPVYAGDDRTLPLYNSQSQKLLPYGRAGEKGEERYADGPVLDVYKGLMSMIEGGLELLECMSKIYRGLLQVAQEGQALYANQASEWSPRRVP